MIWYLITFHVIRIMHMITTHVIMHMITTHMIMIMMVHMIMIGHIVVMVVMMMTSEATQKRSMDKYRKVTKEYQNVFHFVSVKTTVVTFNPFSEILNLSLA